MPISKLTSVRRSVSPQATAILAIGLLVSSIGTADASSSRSHRFQSERYTRSAHRPLPPRSHCTSVLNPSSKGSRLAVDSMVGRYRLTVIRETAIGAGKSAVGVLELRPYHRMYDTSNSRVSLPLVGFTTAALTSLGSVSIGEGRRPRAHDTLGVQFRVDTLERSYQLLVDSNRDYELLPRDRGVYFTILMHDAHGFAGVWRDLGRYGDRLHGRFCADREVGFDPSY